MLDWQFIRPIVIHILSQHRYSNSGRYNGTPSFLTAYQIAVLVDAHNPVLKGSLPIGGAFTGPDSFARQIAWHLSDDITKNIFNGSLEMQFFSIAGLDQFTFGGGNIPSANEFSMFRML
ncbi:MAG: hypothetical protein LBT06_10155 [Hungatella sp.]|jgi:hypothetical protein|nr:hypothetical protein [Hungatella sp.]